MKKLFAALLCAITAVMSLGFTACGDKGTGEELSVYAPDGAPALAIARLMSEEVKFDRQVNYHVVGSEEIKSCVTAVDEDKNADLCILPVNAASKLLGSGERYRMLGVVTHGNLFIAASKDKEDITSDNIVEALSGKKVGVVNLPDFPGSAFKLILNKYDLSDSVTLENVTAAGVSGTSLDYDYFVLPEPAASTRAGNANLGLKIAGSLQSLYGENGYPQAVLVAKKSLIESDSAFIKSFMSEMKTNAEWLMNEEVTAETIISAISEHSNQNTGAMFNAANLSKTVIEHCAIRFDDCTVSASAVNNILTELKAVGDATATAVSDAFFYYNK